jgi:hypothetical protein
MGFFSSSSSIWESPLLRAAKENDMCTLKKLQHDQNCDFRQRGEIRETAEVLLELGLFGRRIAMVWYSWLTPFQELWERQHCM